MLACRAFGYKPCLWSYRIVDPRVGKFEIVQNARYPKVHNLVTVTAGAQISCTCRSGRESFRRTQRGYCVHVYALMTFALQHRGVGRTFSSGYAYAPGNGFAA
jgi:hypothetical protein